MHHEEYLVVFCFIVVFPILALEAIGEEQAILRRTRSEPNLELFFINSIRLFIACGMLGLE